MGVLTLTRSEARRDGLHPFDPRHHMRGVAELVGSVFADELDANGRSLLREMQLVGRFSPILGGVLSLAFFEDFVSGFVWLEEGRVVGNVTLQPWGPHADGTRWRISNVAVAPRFRRRGIGQRLMLAALGEIARRSGTWAVLQVRTDNTAAYRLYEKLGFTDVCRDGLWRLAALPDRLPPLDVSVGLRRLRATNWRARLELAQACQSDLALWASTLNQADYVVGWGRAMADWLSSAIGLYRIERWGSSTDGRLDGAVEAWVSGTGRAHRLRFAVRPAARGRLEAALVTQGLHAMRFGPRRPILAEHSGDHTEGVAALQAAGFQPQRVLLTMRRMIVPADAELGW